MKARYSHTKSKYCVPISMSNCAARMRRMASCESFQPSMAMTLASSGMVRSPAPRWKWLRMRMAKARALFSRPERKQVVERLAVAPRHQLGDVFQHVAEIRRLAVFFVLVAQILHDFPVIVVELDAFGLRDYAHGLIAVIGREQIAVHIGLQFRAVHYMPHVAILLSLSTGRASRPLFLADEELIVSRRHFLLGEEF